jgi:hypothetical protein
MARRIIILPQYVKTPSPKGFQALSQGIHPAAMARRIIILPQSVEASAGLRLPARKGFQALSQGFISCRYNHGNLDI